MVKQFHLVTQVTKSKKKNNLTNKENRKQDYDFFYIAGGNNDADILEY